MQPELIRPVSLSDAPDIARIFNYYVLNTSISFEEAEFSDRQMAGRIEHVLADGFPWLVAEQLGRVVGYAYAAKWREPSAYRYAAQTSVYLDQGVLGQGLGSRLYQALFARLKEMGIRTLIAGIALPNPASVALHEKFGMRKAAHFEAVGFKFNQWLDVGYWQVRL